MSEGVTAGQQACAQASSIVLRWRRAWGQQFEVQGGLTGAGAGQPRGKGWL